MSIVPSQSVYQNLDKIVYLLPGEQPIENKSEPAVIYLREKTSSDESALSKVIDRRMSEFTASLGMYLGGATVVATLITASATTFVAGAALTVAVVSASSLVTRGMQVMGDAAIDGGSYLVRLPFRVIHGVGCGVVEVVKLVYSSVL